MLDKEQDVNQAQNTHPEIFQLNLDALIIRTKPARNSPEPVHLLNSLQTETADNYLRDQTDLQLTSNVSQPVQLKPVQTKPIDLKPVRNLPSTKNIENKSGKLDKIRNFYLCLEIK